jgi:quinol monooxygenase YgiN
MILVIGSIRCPVENLDKIKAPLTALIAATRAEDGCVQYNYGEDVLDPGLFRISEVWRDRAAFEAHLKAPHIPPWRAASAEFGLSGPSLTVWETDEGQPVK